MLGETIDDDKINISNFLVSIACLDHLSLLG